MKIILLLFIALSTFFSFAVKEIPGSSYYLEKSEVDSTIALDEALYTFTFENITDTIQNRIIEYSIDGTIGSLSLIEGDYAEFTTTPGKHIFQFYYSNGGYDEVYTDSIEIKAQHRDDYIVELQPAVIRVIDGGNINIIETYDKPVIYLYPAKEIDIHVNMDIKGSTSFMYPAYNDGWNFKASPDGTISFGEKKYNYLFWESNQDVDYTDQELHSGFVVKGSEAVSFLEDKLTEAGLTSKEQADFITYWGPKLSQNKTNFIHFEFNEVCNRYAEIYIDPVPDNIYRIYMIWKPVEENYSVIEQEIIPLKREGFSVIEWGGCKLRPLLLSKSYVCYL